MRLRKITDRVHYVGINDRTCYRFENLWPVPNGVSYNSYLVMGSDKIAMIDGVEEAFVRGLLANVYGDIQEKKIDYLVVNHMEPDHSGSISSLLQLFPDIKIVGNRITIEMLKGFYNINADQCICINDNDTLSLGGVTLRFIMTPLVHWPETMMTFAEEEGILFSGDAFGCFGALNGGVVDYEMDTDWYFPEMYRYYSNIVGKYGKPVSMAMKKTEHFNIRYICATHGPVWHDRIKDVVGVYQRLSRYEGENGVTIVYGTMYGHTGEVADAIASRLCERGIRNIKVHNVSHSDMSFIISDAFRYKGLIIGSPTYNGHLFPIISDFLTAMEVREIRNKVIATFGSFTWASSACRLMNECVGRLKMDQTATMDMRYTPSQQDFDAAKELADKVADAL